MTPTEFACICDIALKMWRTTLRGGLTDFDEYRSRVLEAAFKAHGAFTIRALCMSAMRDLRRERDREAQVVAHVAFEAQLPHDTLPAEFVVPHPPQRSPNWGGKRPGAGRPKKVAA